MSIIQTISTSEDLEARCAAVPIASNKDRINPKNSYSAVYIDEGLWENRISRLRDISAVTAQNLIKANESSPHSSLDALCAHELERRFPKGFRVLGFKGLIERCLNCFMRITGHTYSAFTDAEKKKYKKQISYSACDRFDLRSTITIQDPTLRKELQIESDDILTTTHRLSKNSPMNGQSYLNEQGEKVTLSQGISSSNDKHAENVSNLRHVSSQAGTSIAYTGRVDTKERALEQAAFIFFSEMRARKQGITSTHIEGQELHEMNYVVSSALSTHPIMSVNSSVTPFAERAALLKEIAALDELKNSGFIDLIDPEDGKTYKVRFHPILFSEGQNFLSQFEEASPPELSGEDVSQFVNAEGCKALSTFVERTIAKLQKQIESASEETSPSKLELETKLEELKTTWKLCTSNHEASSLEKIFHRDFLFKLLQLPVAYHCKSSTDRTGILIALSSALQQWIDLKLPRPEPISELIHDYRFKELFAANLLTGHQITRYARSCEGSIEGQASCPHILGYSFHRGFFQNPAIHRLMPERYLKPYPMQQRLLAASAIVLVHVVCIPLLALQTVWYLGKWLCTGCKKESLTTWRHIFPFSIATSLIGRLRSIPEKVLNESSPQVGARHLLSTSHPKCPNFSSSCLKKTKHGKASPAPFKEARTSSEYQKALADFKQNVGEGRYDSFKQAPSRIKTAFTHIRENIAANPSYTFDTDLANLQNETFTSLKKDLERTYLHNNASRTLIINGKRYGFSPTSPLPRSEQIELQAQEIYETIKSFYIQARPELAQEIHRLELEEKTLFALDELHQGGLFPLQMALTDQFQSDQFLLTSNNHYILELKLDPHEILSDGSRGSLLLRRRFIMEALSIDKLEKRACTKDDTKNELNQYGITLYKDKSLQAEGFVFAECSEELKEDQPLSIRFGVL